MSFNTSFILILLAGIMNGSFVAPAKNMCKKNNEQVWRYHSVIGLLIIPWAIMLVMAPQECFNYFLLPPKTIALIIVGGVLFGIGQMCFSCAIGAIGLGLSFATNLGIGVVIGSMFTVRYRHLLFTSQGALVSIAVLLILLGIILYYFSSKGQQKTASSFQEKRLSHNVGWSLAILAGVASGFQNIVFVLANNAQQQLLFPHTDSFWVWPLFLSAAALIMFIGFSYKIKKNVNYIKNSQSSFKAKEWLALVMMAFLFTGSLALYSKGFEQLGHQQVIVAWPAFMVSIILTTQFWGNVFCESKKLARKKLGLKWLSIFLMMTAIVILGFELH